MPGDLLSISNDKQTFTLKTGLDKLAQLSGNDFTCFHSIIGVFERLGSFLVSITFSGMRDNRSNVFKFLWTSPTACILPLSWIRLHLPVLISEPAQITGRQQEKAVYGDCLIMLLESFIRLVNKLNDDTRFYYTYGTRTFKTRRLLEKAEAFGQGIQERNRNFLAIGLINLAAMTIPPRGASKVFADAQNVSQSPLLPDCLIELTVSLAILSSQSLLPRIPGTFSKGMGRTTSAVVRTL
jgi:hypothetical protein